MTQDVLLAEEQDMTGAQTKEHEEKKTCRDNEGEMR